MNDDYELLCFDMLTEIAALLNEDGKAAKKMAALKRHYMYWRKRESAFVSYSKRTQ